MAKAMRKVRTGFVVRTRTDQTAVVEMVWKQRHRLYRKQVRRVARFYVHDPLNQCRLGDVVRIQEVRPISKTKRWRLMDILERRQVAEVRPIELESDAQVEPSAEELAQQEQPVPLDLLEDEAEREAEEFLEDDEESEAEDLLEDEEEPQADDAPEDEESKE